MITKQPTIEDIYNFDAFITTPGVRDGLLERANSGDPELTTHDTDDGPVVYYNAPHGEEIAVGRPIQLAEVGATKMGDYGYSGERQATMTDYDPTVRERLAEFLQAGFERFGMDRYKARQNAQTLMGGPSSNLPLQTGIADIVPFLGTALQTQEAARLGGESVESAKRGEYGTAAVQAGFAGLGMIPGAVGTVQAGKALAPTAGKMAMDVAEKTGMPVRGLGIVEPGASAAGKATAPVSDTGFYSAVEQAALNIQRKSGTGQAMLNDITKGENVKADEIKWIGLDDFLKGKKNVTREEVQQYIAANKVDVQEVQLADVKASPVSTENITDYFEETLTPNGDEARGIFNLSFTEKGASEPTSFTAYEMKGGSVELYDNRGNFIDEYRTLTDAREHVINESEFSASQADGKTKFGQWQLPGGDNYREILLTLPENFGAKTNKDGYTPLSAIGDAQYRSSHWDQPNVLAHIRVNDRVDADGKKMLLVEEVQSDWHQAGRDKGYGPKTETTVEAYYLSDSGRRISLGYGRTQEEAAAAVDPGWKGLVDVKFDSQTKTVGEGVPDAPMKDTWYQLALKRVLKYAADNGYERVGLTTGSRQAERYNLSKQIDAVTWIPKGDGTYDFEVLKDGATIISKRDADASWLKDNIGKELAQKIVNDQHTDILERSGRRFIEGNDLSVGGEGMKKYYDEVYPQFLAKYGKKWGAKVGETKLKTSDIDPARWTIVRDADNNFRIQDSLSDRFAEPGAYATREAAIEAIGKMNYREPVRFVDITPEMREGVGKGQPLFTATGVGVGTGATMQDKEQK